jgi:hypothetical protein
MRLCEPFPTISTFAVPLQSILILAIASRILRQIAKMAIHHDQEVDAITDTEAVPKTNVLLAPIKSNDIYGRREKAEKSQWGAAAFATSHSFKFDKGKGKPRAKRWDRMPQLSLPSGLMY